MKFCRVCGAVLTATCNKTQKSKLCEFKGRDWTKTKPQFMWLYPTARKQSNLCFYHQQKKEDGLCMK